MLQQFGTGDQARIVQVGQRQHLSLAARGDDDVFGRNRITAHADSVGIHERGMSAQQGDSRMSEDGLDASPQLCHHLLLTLDGLGKRSTVNIGLGGYAAPVQAGAPHLVLLDNHHTQPLLGGIFSGAVATRPRADDQ